MIAANIFARHSMLSIGFNRGVLRMPPPVSYIERQAEHQFVGDSSRMAGHAVAEAALARCDSSRGMRSRTLFGRRLAGNCRPIDGPVLSTAESSAFTVQLQQCSFNSAASTVQVEQCNTRMRQALAFKKKTLQAR